MSSENERLKQADEYTLIEPTPVLTLIKESLIRGALVFLGCMMGEVYGPYLLGYPISMEQHNALAKSYIFWTAVLSLIAFLMIFGLDRRRVKQNTHPQP